MLSSPSELTYEQLRAQYHAADEQNDELMESLAECAVRMHSVHVNLERFQRALDLMDGEDFAKLQPLMSSALSDLLHGLKPYAK